jgi:hypothetical protein
MLTPKVLQRAMTRMLRSKYILASRSIGLLLLWGCLLARAHVMALGVTDSACMSCFEWCRCVLVLALEFFIGEPGSCAGRLRPLCAGGLL